MDSWRRLDEAAPAEAGTLLMRACGSPRWADRMLARRPFGGQDAMLAAARDEWWALGPDDWLEAFRQHPKIGDRASLAARAGAPAARTVRGGVAFPGTHELSAREQAGVAGAAGDVLDALAEGNRAYQERFGYIFIVCATGKTALEMLSLLHARLGNHPDAEIRIAAEEQAKITALRLNAL